MRLKSFLATFVFVLVVNCARGQNNFYPNGLYGGLHLGYGSVTSKFCEAEIGLYQATNVRNQNQILVVVPGTRVILPAYSYKEKAGLREGLQLGYGRRFQQRFYAALEFDLDLVSFSTSSPQSIMGVLPATLITSSSDYRIFRGATQRWNESLRLRFGYVKERSLIYATAGFAFAGSRIQGLDHYSTTCCGSNPGVAPGTVYPATDRSEELHELAMGATVGAGFSWAFNQNINLGVEFRHTNMSSSFSMPATEAGAVSNGSGSPGMSVALPETSEKIEFSGNQFSVRMNFMIGRLIGRQGSHK